MAANFPRTLEIMLLYFICLISWSEAREHIVGGKSNAWKVPSSESGSLNHWAEKSRFNIGDSLVWESEYGSKLDPLLQVTKRDYVTCNISSPIETYTGGNIKVELGRSGPYYFISGEEDHCQKGQKLIVVVISEKHRRVSPAPSPVVGIEGPAVAPAPSSGVGSLRGGFLVLVLGAVLVVL